MATARSRGECPSCDKNVAFTKDGNPYKHACVPLIVWNEVPVPEPETFEDPTVAAEPEPESCGAGCATCSAYREAFDEVTDDPEHPRTPEPQKGPWFGALYDGRCSSCEDRIREGDRIRADGEGGYECADCGGHPWAQDEELAQHVKTPDTTHPGLRVPTAYQEQASAAARRHLEAQAAPAADDLFEDPTKPEDKPKKFNVSGQPEAERDWLGRYIVKDPDTGNFRWLKNGKAEGITRVTTFNKAAQNSKGLHDWANRNVVIGASLRPDILRSAHGLRHDNGDDATDKVHRDALNRIVAQLSEAAGGKVSADEGSYLHEETEYIDAGWKTWEKCPAAYQQDLKRYVEALEAHGLEPLPGLIERTTMISEFGGVCGTFDRIFYHRLSGAYVIGDLKTGKTMKYALDETETQMWCYAHGVNTNGIYNWNTKTWEQAWDPREHLDGPIKVREDVGVIIHMPVQGKEAGTVNVLLADLEAGKAHAELCHRVRSRPSRKPVLWASWAAPEPTWGERFAEVRDKEHATALWLEAKAAGISGVDLAELVRTAQDVLRSKG